MTSTEAAGAVHACCHVPAADDLARTLDLLKSLDAIFRQIAVVDNAPDEANAVLVSSFALE